MTFSAFTAANQLMGDGCLDQTQFYGSCQDHVTLLETLLKALPEAMGIASSPALTNASDADRLPQAFYD